MLIRFVLNIKFGFGYKFYALNYELLNSIKKMKGKHSNG